MGLASTARYNSRLTAQTYKLVAVERLELLATGYTAAIGTCGHRLTVLSPRQLPAWEAALEGVTAGTGKAPRKRCEGCRQDA